MSVENRLEQLRRFCNRQGWELKVWRGTTQQEPVKSLTVSMGEGQATLRTESADSLEVAVARMELALVNLAGARSDVYLFTPHHQMGAIAGG